LLADRRVDPDAPAFDGSGQASSGATEEIPSALRRLAVERISHRSGFAATACSACLSGIVEFARYCCKIEEEESRLSAVACVRASVLEQREARGAPLRASIASHRILDPAKSARCNSATPCASDELLTHSRPPAHGPSARRARGLAVSRGGFSERGGGGQEARAPRSTRACASRHSEGRCEHALLLELLVKLHMERAHAHASRCGPGCRRIRLACPSKRSDQRSSPPARHRVELDADAHLVVRLAGHCP
jgi:hypothetical protein